MNGDPPARRTCGSCTQCCKVMAIEELEKPVGVWCVHCTPGKGCGIYGCHPAPCQSFACQWLLEPAMPHRFRPDQSKVVLTTDGDGARLVAHCDPANPAAWRRGPMYDLLKQQARATWGTGMNVLAKAGRHLWLITPGEEIDLGEVDPRSAFKIEVADRNGPPRVTILPPLPKDSDVATHVAALRATPD